MKKNISLRRTASACALAILLPLSGCGSLTGLDADSDFSCPMKPGVSCRSLSDTYEDSVKGRTPDRIERDKAIEQASKGLPDISEEKSDDKGDAAKVATTEFGQALMAQAPDANAKAQPARRDAGTPKRLPEVIVTIWIAPWTDDEGDFHEGERIHARAFDARWAAARRRAEAADASAVVKLPFSRSTLPARVAPNRDANPVADTGISPFGEGSRRYIEAQKAALKGTPYDPEPIAGEAMAQREVR